MKPLKIIAVFVLGIVLGISSINAQQNGERNQFRFRNLTQEQQQLFQEQQALIKQNRETLKASLTQEQLAILENLELTKQERHEALVATFTEAQQALMANNRNRVREIKETAINQDKYLINSSANRKLVKPGYLVLFQFDVDVLPDHIGIVSSIDSDSVKTIEFNTSAENNTNGGAVSRRDRPFKTIDGFVKLY